MNKKIDINVIRRYVIDKKVVWTKHCLNRIQSRNILVSDVKNAIYSGKIIEYYYDDYPYPSCLILGYSINNKILHIVCGIGENILYMITAYYPDRDKWEYNNETRRKNDEVL